MNNVIHGGAGVAMKMNDKNSGGRSLLDFHESERL